MASQCGAITREGGRCQASVPPGAEWCFNHDPTRAEERKRNARRAGKARGGGAELTIIKRSIREVIDGVLEGSLERGVGAVAFQGYNTLLKALESERKLREAEELEERLTLLEQAMEQRRGSHRQWG